MVWIVICKFIINAYFYFNYHSGLTLNFQISTVYNKRQPFSTLSVSIAFINENNYTNSIYGLMGNYNGISRDDLVSRTGTYADLNSKTSISNVVSSCNYLYFFYNNNNFVLIWKFFNIIKGPCWQMKQIYFRHLHNREILFWSKIAAAYSWKIFWKNLLAMMRSTQRVITTQHVSRIHWRQDCKA